MRKDTLSSFRNSFNPYLHHFFAEKKAQLKNSSQPILTAVEQIANITLSGGKRIRPAFIYYGYKLCGGKSFLEIKNYLLAIEILQTFSLIHDDIIDRATKRRGVETINSLAGNDMAILCGDLANTWSDELFYQNHPAKKLSSLFAQMKQKVIMGQILDLYSPQNETEAITMMKWKTASYSVEKPLMIGAILAKAKKHKTLALSTIGLNIGLAFQAQDDVFGVFGKEEKLGKSNIDDLRNGKKTLLYFKTLSKLGKKEKETFLSSWGNINAGIPELKRIQKLIKTSGGLAEVINIYKKWKKEAETLLLSTDLENRYRTELLGIINDILILEKNDLYI